MRWNVSLDMRMHGKSNPCFKSTTSIHFWLCRLAVMWPRHSGETCTAMAELLEHLALGTDNMSISEGY
jgi:hypothetical protein